MKNKINNKFKELYNMKNTNKKQNYLLMSFSTGQESKEGTPLKRYSGVGSVKVLAVNPTKKELEKIYENDVDNEPTYKGESDVTVGGVDKKVESIRLDFIVETDPAANNGIEVKTKIAFFLNKENRFNKDGSKVQVIDKYGRTAWVTPEELEKKAIPMYSNGPASLSPDYRPAYIGEEQLTSFIIDYLNIPGPQNYKEGVWVDKTAKEMANAEARFDEATILKLFTGDVAQIKAILAMQPNNKVKACFGVKTADSNVQYQDVYTRMFLKNGVSRYDRLEKDIKSAQDNGSYPNTEFTFGGLQEHNMQATNFGTEASGPAANPFGNMPVNPFVNK
jgi:hypothetical protein